MDNQYLQELITEAKARGGGLLLSMENSPAAVVLTVEKYNQLVSGSVITSFAKASEGKQSVSKSAEQITDTLPQPNLINMNQIQSKNVLVTGGAGYIGSHAVIELIKSGYNVTVIDNLSCGKRENVDERAKFIEGDLADENFLADVFAAGGFNAVCHFAASIEVEESVREPQKYFTNNATNTAKLLRAMAEAGVRHLVFSSTAAVYGEQQQEPIKETAKLKPNNPYGHSKMLAEKIIRYYCEHLSLRAVVFRYFNVCGFGQDRKIYGTHFSHLMPIVLDVAKGQRPALVVNGDDYQTSDGTCVRDYVHVLDIAQPHVLALNKMDEGENFKVFNIGTGHGSSVKEVINAASETLNKIIPMEIGPRRPGDVAILVADNSKLVTEFGYRPRYSDLPSIIKTTWDNML